MGLGKTWDGKLRNLRDGVDRKQPRTGEKTGRGNVTLNLS